jgi:hypothetical protein
LKNWLETALDVSVCRTLQAARVVLDGWGFYVDRQHVCVCCAVVTSHLCFVYYCFDRQTAQLLLGSPAAASMLTSLARAVIFCMVVLLR